MGIIGIICKKNSKKNSNNNQMCCLELGLVPLMLLTNQTIKLILHEGTTKVIKRRWKIKAGEIMFEFPDSVVCHADSFFLGKPLPILSIHDHLVAGRTYFVLPLDRLPAPPEGGGGSGSGGALLSAASLSYLGSPSSSGCPNAKPPPPSTMLKLLNGQNGNSSNVSNYSNGNKSSNNKCKGPFEYVKDKDGRVLMIKVVPEFIARIIANNSGTGTITATTTTTTSTSGSAKVICSTPELQRQYEQLVRAKDQAWSPKLKTISEHNMRFSPSRLIRLEWKQREI